MEKKYLGSTGLAKFLENLYNVFSQVGHTHTKSQITDFPTIPTKVSQLDNDSGFVNHDENTTYTLTKDGSTITLTGTDGSTMSVEDSDTIIPVDSELLDDSLNPVQNKVIKSEFDAINALIGEASVEEQIEAAMNSIPQVDWDETDDSSLAFIKNRPFYEGIISLFDGDLIVGRYGAANFDQSLSVESGQEYTVVVDGMMMTGTARYTETEYTIGNNYYDESGNYIFSVYDYGINLADDHYPEGTVVHVTVSTYDVKQIDEKYVKWAMRNEDPVGTGSFSMNRKPNTTVGFHSHAEGSYNTASGSSSHAEGGTTTASGQNSHAEGNDSTASGTSSHAEGYDTTASGQNSHAEGNDSTASGTSSHAEGELTTASGSSSHAEGNGSTASGYYSHAEGLITTASNRSQHVQGEYNILDTSSTEYERGKYAHIVGNGTHNSPSNAHTLDWYGVGWYQGGLQVGGRAQDDGAKNVLLEGDAIPVPEAAEVGQLLAVKAVHENGRPSEWEAVDFPENSIPVFVAQPEAPEDTTVLWLDTDDNTPAVPGSHGVVWDLVNVISSNNVVSVSNGSALISVLTPAEGYSLGDVTVTMGSEALTGVWNADTSTLTIVSVTGDVVVSCAGVEQTIVDTSLRVAYEGKRLNADNTLSDNINLCVSDYYLIPNGSNGAITYQFADVGVSGIGAMKICTVDDNEVFVNYNSTGQTTIGTPKSGKFTLANGELRATKFRFDLGLATLDDSYMYLTQTGEVVFAGKNTQYYGMANIDGTMAGSPTVASSMSVDADYAMDYGIAVTSLVTDEAESTKVDIDEAYAAVIEEAKNAWMCEANGNIDKIPLIIHTDQHANFNKPLFDFIAEIVDWYDVGKIINLGDTVSNYKGDDLFGDSQLDSYIESMSSVPYSKRIEVFGNHDTWGDNGNGTGRITPQNFLYKYFRNIYARRFDNYGNFVTYDDNYNVKYVVVSGFAYDSEKGGYSYFIINPDSLEKIIAELERADGYDVVILSHAPLTQSGVTPIDPTTGADALYKPTGQNSVSFKELSGLWGARKTKGSGTVTDEYGNEHAYDFTECDGELLCSLHGHMHEDSYYYTDNAVLSACFDAYYISPKAFFFVIVDRENRRLNVWKVDETPQYQNYQLPFDKPTE